MMDNQRVMIELESAQETAALWAVAARIGGNNAMLRGLFSSLHSQPDAQHGLHELLTPIVMKQTQLAQAAIGRRRMEPLTIRHHLESLYDTQLNGRIELNQVRHKITG
ncbi:MULTISPECIES: hypothetical protein [Halomonas]|uniref:hypothetical protein n=1 Tax=Halomonas TaxID=2745 RepID=UPI001868D527|nr:MULTISPECIES: hypothetical protein [Halomonas]